MAGRIILSSELLQLTLRRLSHQLIEHYDDFSDAVLIGLQAGGVPLVERLAAIIKAETGKAVQTGKLDITFYRDDFRTREKPLSPSTTDIEFMLEDKRTVLVDDVLYTGRSVRAAMDAMLSFGRPKSVELLVLIDRRFNRELPIQPDYVGLDVDTIDDARVLVEWGGDDSQSHVILLKDNRE